MYIFVVRKSDKSKTFQFLRLNLGRLFVIYARFSILYDSFKLVALSFNRHVDLMATL